MLVYLFHRQEAVAEQWRLLEWLRLRVRLYFSLWWAWTPPALSTFSVVLTKQLINSVFPSSLQNDTYCFSLCYLRWDCSFQYGSLVEEVDGHTAILYHRLQLDWFSGYVLRLVRIFLLSLLHTKCEATGKMKATRHISMIYKRRCHYLISLTGTYFVAQMTLLIVI
jgi:hypothetical protein